MPPSASLNEKNVILPSSAIDRPLSIEIYSDLICPWCYIGRKRLQPALDALVPQVHATVHWHPFQLNPTMPAEGMERRAYRTRKFGSWSRSQTMDQEVATVGRSLGLEFNFEQILKTPNTFLGHRLLWWAANRGKQDVLSEALFAAYFTEGRDLGDLTVLAEIAARVGLPRADTSEFLASSTGADEVHQKEDEGRRKGISGVPFFVINGTIELSGAQPPEVWVKVFQALETSSGSP